MTLEELYREERALKEEIAQRDAHAASGMVVVETDDTPFTLLVRKGDVLARGCDDLWSAELNGSDGTPVRVSLAVLRDFADAIEAVERQAHAESLEEWDEHGCFIIERTTKADIDDGLGGAEADSDDLAFAVLVAARETLGFAEGQVVAAIISDDKMHFEGIPDESPAEDARRYLEDLIALVSLKPEQD